jgi:hypothetical protein
MSAAILEFGEGGVAPTDASKPRFFVARLQLCFLRFVIGIKRPRLGQGELCPQLVPFL